MINRNVHVTYIDHCCDDPDGAEVPEANDIERVVVTGPEFVTGSGQQRKHRPLDAFARLKGTPRSVREAFYLLNTA